MVTSICESTRQALLGDYGGMLDGGRQLVLPKTSLAYTQETAEVGVASSDSGFEPSLCFEALGARDLSLCSIDIQL